VAEKAAAGGSASVSGTVTLAPALAAKAAPDDTVFIFARAAEGPRMPLAILRKKVSDLPVTFTLDDSMAMSPAARLSGTPQVIIGARISKSGEALPKPGDLQGFTKPVSNSAKNIAIVIDTEIQ
jgi:cytochrome c-type biogenesis protein CcmH